MSSTQQQQQQDQQQQLMTSRLRASVSSAEQMRLEAEKRLSNFKEFDVDFLETVVLEMNSGRDDNFRNCAIKILQTLKDQSESWQIVEPILTHSKMHDTIFFGLILLEDMVIKKWRSLPMDDRLSLNKFVKEFTQKTLDTESSEPSTLRVLKKLNKITVEIAKKEYPINWPDFIKELANTDKITSEYHLVNNMMIIRFFVEDIFKFSEGKIQQIRLQSIQNSILEDFSLIHSISMLIFQNFTNKDVINETISCLTSFNKHVPISFFTETNLLETLCSNTYLTDTKYSSKVLLFLSEFTSRQDITQLGDKVSQLFNTVVNIVSTFLPPDMQLDAAYPQMDENEKEFIDSFGNFIERTIHGRHKRHSEIEMPFVVVEYMLRMSRIKNGDNFQLYTKFWNEASLMLDRFSLEQQEYFIREVTTGFASNMAKPEEVIVMQDESGNIVREKLKRTQEIKKYQEMQEVLVNLVKKNDYLVTHIMTTLLKKQTGTYGAPVVDSDEDIDEQYYGSNESWSFDLINSVCWSIGAIYNCLNKETEVKFLVLILRELLNMNEALNVPSSKAVIATNIMYLVGQYPRFLVHNWNFCLTVISKLFEFMHEQFEGVKDMSCDTFAKIVDHCKDQFAMTFPEADQNYNSSEVPQLIKFINQLPSTIRDLEDYQKVNVYDSMAKILNVYINRQNSGQEKELDEDPYELLVWDHVASIVNVVEILNNNQYSTPLQSNSDSQFPFKTSVSNSGVQANNQNVMQQIFLNVSCLRNLSLSINVLSTVGSHAGFPFKITSHIIPALDLLYQHASTVMYNANHDPQVQAVYAHLKTFKKDILNYLKQLVLKLQKTDMGPNHLELARPLILTVLKDYSEASEQHKEAEIINVLKALLELGSASIFVSPIIETCLVSTLQMIKKDFTEYPDHRFNIFGMVYTLVQRHFETLMTIAESEFRLIIDTVIFALNHILANILEIGLDILLELIVKMSYCVDKAQIFFRYFFSFIIQHLLILISDPAYRLYLDKHSNIISLLVQQIKSGFIKIELSSEIPDSAAIENYSSGQGVESVVQRNVDFFEKWLDKFVSEKYGNISRNDKAIFIKGLIAFSGNRQKMLSHIQDFVIEVQENRGDSFVDPYTAAKIQEIEAVVANNNASTN